MTSEKLNRIFSGIVFVVTFIIYFDTMAPTVSYWDCGEFIATSYILGAVSYTHLTLPTKA